MSGLRFKRETSNAASSPRRRTMSLLAATATATSPVELSALKYLSERGAVEFDWILREVANQVYGAELRRASAVDVGLWGPDLFVSQVARELWARDGELWRIE